MFGRATIRLGIGPHSSWFGFGIRNSIKSVCKIKCCGDGMAIGPQQGANDLHMVWLMPLSPHHLLLH